MRIGPQPTTVDWSVKIADCRPAPLKYGRMEEPRQARDTLGRRRGMPTLIAAEAQRWLDEPVVVINAVT